MIKTPKLKKLNTVEDSKQLAMAAVEGMLELKAKQVVCLDLRELNNAVSDFYVICNADSRTQVDAIARSVEEFVDKNLNQDPFHREGFQNSEWILLDYFNVVVHIFQTEKREFYGLERLWADADTQSFE